MLYGWLTDMVDELSKRNSCDLGAKEMRKVIDFMVKSAWAVKEERENLKNNKERKETMEEFGSRIMKKFLQYQDDDGNNVLMILAKHMMDGALREMLTNDMTTENITHSVLAVRNNLKQTLMSLIEVNREDMPESLALVLKVEYACHAGNLTEAEICLSGQMETSNSSFEIIKGLHQLQPLTWCQKFNIWFILFLTWLVPSYGLSAGDWIADGYLVFRYWNEWTSEANTFNTYCRANKTALTDHWNQFGNLTAAR